MPQSIQPFGSISRGIGDFMVFSVLKTKKSATKRVF